ncbi:MAG: tRNA uridine-5-carboxymethylaminomethyl(34) synthesis GTPase MnmE [Candidatus Omnitrophica bacterium]|nr:tRNA uridine-5-carboxymethylaminomethyl(34) synthesis GTPase MnmE [Candidatus Omnitrophota bacterium]
MEDTIVAVSTPVGEGGIGIVRLSGRDALRIADSLFVPKDGGRPSAYDTYTVHYGHIVDQEIADEPIDEVILTVMRAPRSYTREDVVEINCHGGIQAVRRVLDLALRYGGRVAEPGEFTKRAFLNGRIDLVQAEAVLDVIKAKTESSLKAAIDQLEGGLSDTVNGIRESVIGIASHVEALIDFPEEEIDIAADSLVKRCEAAVTALQKLIDTFAHGMVLREGVLAVICGKPNVGKSSLMNLLLKRDRVIVTPVPGTTRDAVEEMINLKGIPVRLVDTAGIAETADVVEREGVKRSKRYLDRADLALQVFDSSSAIGDEDAAIARLTFGKKRISVLNKCDLPRITARADIEALCKGSAVVEISVLRKERMESLEKAIIDAVWSGEYDRSDGTVVANARHKELLDKAFRNMISVTKALKEGLSPELAAVDLREAIHNLGLIVGRSVSDDILDTIFNEFCIGK